MCEAVEGWCVRGGVENVVVSRVRGPGGSVRVVDSGAHLERDARDRLGCSRGHRLIVDEGFERHAQRLKHKEGAVVNDGRADEACDGCMAQLQPELPHVARRVGRRTHLRPAARMVCGEIGYFGRGERVSPLEA